jgi:hypothetical protein
MTSNLTTMIAWNHFGEDEFRMKCVVIANSTLTKNNVFFQLTTTCLYAFMTCAGTTLFLL